MSHSPNHESYSETAQVDPSNPVTDPFATCLLLIIFSSTMIQHTNSAKTFCRGKRGHVVIDKMQRTWMILASLHPRN